MYLKLTESQKQLVNEISALSGLQKEVIREVWEFTMMRWIEQISKDPHALTSLDVPFLGTIGVRYLSDNVETTGAVTTVVEAFVALAPQFKKIVGDLVDESSTIVDSLVEKKINNAILTLSAESD